MKYRVIIYKCTLDADFDGIYEENREILKTYQVNSFKGAAELVMSRKFNSEFLDQIRENDTIDFSVNWTVVNPDNKIIEDDNILNITRILQYENNNVTYKDVGNYIESHIRDFYFMQDDYCLEMYSEILKELLSIKPFYKVSNKTKYYLGL